MRIVIALGGNALLRRSDPMTTEVQRKNIEIAADVKHLNVRQAAFIGVGSMVGAGIFALLGAAGAVAGAAVWLSSLIAGVVAMLFATAGAANAGLYLVTLAIILALSIGLDYWWKRSSAGKAEQVQVAH